MFETTFNYPNYAEARTSGFYHQADKSSSLKLYNLPYWKIQSKRFKRTGRKRQETEGSRRNFI